ncbi:MAG: hypothetical protein IKF52_05265 [Clostridia bacterium]|nr:hypothetical protein [Clostridia bacterium]
MEERSLKVIDTNKTFFGKISNTLSKILIPTKIGINGFVINMKRNNLIKSYEIYSNFDGSDENKKKSVASKYEEAYSLYLEAIDKHIMDSVYKKVKSNVASEFEKNAISNYYNITSLKNTEYIEYKFRKQKYLIELDYESLKISGKEKVINRYTDFYLTKMDSFYKGILKNYSVQLADSLKKNSSKKDKIYENIFSCIEEYIQNIIPIKLEDDDKKELFNGIMNDYNKYQNLNFGKLDQNDIIEKRMLLLGMSRKIFTHSLPLVAAEQCYEKLIDDTRKLIISSPNEKKKLESYDMLIELIEEYNIKLLSTKVYWEKPSDREKYKKFWSKYERAKKSKDKEILFLKREIDLLDDKDKNNKKILKFYKDKLVEFGAMRIAKDGCKSMSGRFAKKV